MTINRRMLLATGGALAATAALGAEDSPPKKKGKVKKATYVLVHGGGHGGWCWTRVAEPLRAHGHEVYAPSLTGLADRSHLLNPDVDLDTQITDIVNLLKWENLNKVILVGHSYGGLVITGIADRARDRIGHMVYYDAIHPKNGTSLWPRPNAAVAGAAAAGGSGVNPATMVRVVNGVELVLFPDEQLIKGALGVTKPEDVHKLPTTDIWRKSILAAQQKSGREFSGAQRLWAIDSPSHDLMVTNPQESVEMLLKLAAI